MSRKGKYHVCDWSHRGSNLISCGHRGYWWPTLEKWLCMRHFTEYAGSMTRLHTRIKTVMEEKEDRDDEREKDEQQQNLVIVAVDV